MTMQVPSVEANITVRIPMTFVKRGGRKVVIAPNGAPGVHQETKNIDSVLVKAVARGFRWRKLLETGVYATADELATAEKINPSYVSRILRLTLLAPRIVEAIVEGRQSDQLTLKNLMQPFPIVWAEQWSGQ